VGRPRGFTYGAQDQPSCGVLNFNTAPRTATDQRKAKDKMISWKRKIGPMTGMFMQGPEIHIPAGARFYPDILGPSKSRKPQPEQAVSAKPDAT